MVGKFGPFTLVTTQEALNSGSALVQMRNFANSLAMLPGVQP
jgi:hypothetical protein